MENKLLGSILHCIKHTTCMPELSDQHNQIHNLFEHLELKERYKNLIIQFLNKNGIQAKELANTSNLTYRIKGPATYFVTVYKNITKVLVVTSGYPYIIVHEAKIADI